MENKEQILDEVRQLCRQYLNEVPSKRRIWPKSIKERVLQLLELESSCEEVAAGSGIPVATIYAWKAARASAAAFLPVKVLEAKTIANSPVTVQQARQAVGRKRRSKRALTITVVMPNGIRFEGLDVNTALEVARRLDP